MEKKIEDYLHLYLGCVCECGITEDVKEKRLLDEISPSVIEMSRKGWVKPLLRPLSDMTEGELEELLNIRTATMDEFRGKQGVENGNHTGFTAGAEAKYLLSKHFDLFGLIESGLAIDKTQENKTHIYEK